LRSFQEDPVGSQAILKEVLKSKSGIEDPLRLLLAEAQLAGGREAAAQRSAERVKDPRWAARAAWIAGRAALKRDCKQALQYLRVADPDPLWIPAPERLEQMRQAWLLCDSKEQAEALRRRLAIEHPQSPQGRAAALDLKLSFKEELRRAEAFEAAREYRQAEQLLNALMGGEQDLELKFRLGKLHLERIRLNFSLSVRAFEEVMKQKGTHQEEASYLRARALGRAGEGVKARLAFKEYAEAWPKGLFLADARFFSAFLLYEEGRYKEASAAFKGLNDPKWKRAARWYRAWCSYLAGAKEAFSLLDLLAQGGDRRAAYWAAQALEPRNPAAARLRQISLVVEQPLDWYSLLLQRAHPEIYPDHPALPPVEWSKPLPPPALAEAGEEISALARAGLYDFGRRALSILMPRLERQGDEALILYLSGLTQAPHQGMLSALRRHPQLWRQVPQPEEALSWYGAYPLAFAQKIAKLQVSAPLLIHSYIRKESAYRVEAVSPAHALGLMQLMPSTAAKIKPEGGYDLFRPLDNIKMGSNYLKALSLRFQGQQPLIAAAYNAGPKAVISWIKGRGEERIDRFVDLISYRETRGYVKRLMTTWVRYRMIYGGKSLREASAVLPLKLDLKVKPGVSY